MDLSDISRLDAWPLEDITLIHILEQWKGDFLLTHRPISYTCTGQYRSVNTYCSLCHPWRIH